MASTVDPNLEKLPFGERLLASGLVSRAQLNVALIEQRRTREPIGKILVALGFLTQDQVNAIVFEDAHVERVALRGRRIEAALLRGISLDRLRQLVAVPYERIGDTWKIAVSDPSDVLVADSLAALFPGTRQIVGATRAEILECLREAASLQGSPLAATTTVESSGDAVRALDQLLNEGVTRRATDVHLEPEEKITRARYRVDGVLCAGPAFSLDVAAAVLSRLKLLAGLDISIKRMPQDGRFRHEGPTGSVDCRVSTIPTVYGENAVVRLLDGSHGAARLASLELPPAILADLQRAIAKPYGMVYVVGATGSGKTTSLYALLGSLDAMQRKICTVEDPVEYRLPLARQTQVQPEIGFEFASALRALLRQDPDVILVGETRDTETAEIALRAALTGHLVLSTLHANGAAAAPARLIQMGLDPFLLNSTLSAVLAQTLLRRGCPRCRRAEAPNAAMVRFFSQRGVAPPAQVYRTAGCVDCGHTGFRGRVAAFELLVPNAEIREAISRRASAAEIEAIAIRCGLEPIERAVAQKAASGVTTMEEAARVIGVPEGDLL